MWEAHLLQESYMILKDAIEDKEYLSNKEIEEIVVPESVNRIGSWAFAHAKNLKKITLPSKEITLGKDAFLDCPNLKEVVIYPDESDNKDLPELFAKAITVFNDASLFNPREASRKDSHRNWIKKFDDRLIDYIGAKDDLGFSPVLIGWFDDTGEDEQREIYKRNRQEDKARICFFRLKCNALLDAEHLEKIKEYVSGHFKSGDTDGDMPKSYGVTYDVLCEEFYNDLDTVKALEEAGLFNKEIRNDFISVLGDKGANPEIIAYLVNKASLEEVGLSDDAFEGFNL